MDEVCSWEGRGGERGTGGGREDDCCKVSPGTREVGRVVLVAACDRVTQRMLGEDRACSLHGMTEVSVEGLHRGVHRPGAALARWDERQSDEEATDECGSRDEGGVVRAGLLLHRQCRAVRGRLAAGVHRHMASIAVYLVAPSARCGCSVHSIIVSISVRQRAAHTHYTSLPAAAASVRVQHDAADTQRPASTIMHMRLSSVDRSLRSAGHVGQRSARKPEPSDSLSPCCCTAQSRLARSRQPTLSTLY